jgi:hypothetical protein
VYESKRGREQQSRTRGKIDFNLVFQPRFRMPILLERIHVIHIISLILSLFCLSAQRADLWFQRAPLVPSRGCGLGRPPYSRSFARDPASAGSESSLLRMRNLNVCAHVIEQTAQKALSVWEGGGDDHH